MTSATASPPQTEPKQYAIACPPECSLHADKIGADKAQALLDIINAGTSIDRFVKSAEPVLGRKLNRSTAALHLAKHKRELFVEAEEAVPERKASDVEILDQVIQAAWANRKSWKPSLRDMLEAMSKKHQITGGSEVSDLMALFDAPEIDIPDENDVLEAEIAILSPEERKNDDSDDLEA